MQLAIWHDDGGGKCRPNDSGFFERTQLVGGLRLDLGGQAIAILADLVGGAHGLNVIPVVMQFNEAAST